MDREKLQKISALVEKFKSNNGLKTTEELLDGLQNNGHKMDQPAMLQIILANQNIKEKSPIINSLIEELESFLDEQ
jgi:hypothetical protein